MAQVAVDAMEEMTGEQGEPEDDQPPTKESESTEEPKELQEPAEEPKEPAKEPAAEDDLLISREDMDAIRALWGSDEAEEESPKSASASSKPAQAQQFEQPPALPQDVLSISPQQFMPEGQDFDPMDVYTQGSPSHQAAVAAQAEQTRRINAHEKERERQEQVARKGAEAIGKLNARMEREKWPQVMRQRFWNRMTSEDLDLDLLGDAFVLSERKALRKAQKAQQSGDGGEPPPVSKASRVTETPKTPDAAKKEADETFGPRRQSAI